MDTIESLDLEIRELTKQQEQLERKIAAKLSKRDKMMIEANRKHFGNIEWLINNPDTPGQWQAMRDWLADRYGGEWMGVNASGYYPTINQQAFSITLSDRYGDGQISQKVENVRAFLAECLDYFKPKDDGFVSFTYTTGQHSGVFDLCYQPSEKTWWTTNTRYGCMVEKRRHADLDAAIRAAQAIAARVKD